MKLEIMLEKQKGKGYKYPFKLMLSARSDNAGSTLTGNTFTVGLNYKGIRAITQKLEIEPIEFREKVLEYKGKFFGEDRNIFFKNKEQAAKFSNEYLVPYMVAQRLRKAK